MTEPKKKVAKKKAPAPFPENTTRSYGACVRKMMVGKEEAAKLVKEFGFRVTFTDGEHYHVMADSKANREYEGSK